jgi:hypothetical protein
MSLAICPNSHPTCWPDACPVCRAARIPFQGRRTKTPKEARAEGLADYWARRRARLEAAAAHKAKLARMGLR